MLQHYHYRNPCIFHDQIFTLYSLYSIYSGHVRATFRDLITAPHVAFNYLEEEQPTTTAAVAAAPDSGPHAAASAEKIELLRQIEPNKRKASNFRIQNKSPERNWLRWTPAKIKVYRIPQRNSAAVLPAGNPSIFFSFVIFYSPGFRAQRSGASCCVAICFPLPKWPVRAKKKRSETEEPDQPSHHNTTAGTAVSQQQSQSKQKPR